jgi:hypothetical protein
MVSLTLKNKIMKNIFKLGFLAFAMAVSLTACNFFSSDPKKDLIDTTKIDTSLIDTTKIDTNKKELNQTNPDSATIKQ